MIENWDDNIVSMNLVKTAAANFFIAERRDQTKHLYAIESASEVPQVLNNLNELPELVYNLLDLGAVSVSGDPIKLVYLNGRLYLLEQTSTNFKMYSYNGSGFVEIQGTMPPQRNILNVATSGKYMFLAGGTDFNNNALSDLWRFDSETDTWTLVTNALQGDFRKVIMQEVDGEIIAFNPVINGNRTFPAFEFVNAELVENIEISYFEIVIPYDELLNGDYCLKETGTALQGGIETSGECVPFTHQWYNSFSAGTTVYSEHAPCRNGAGPPRRCCTGGADCNAAVRTADGYYCIHGSDNHPDADNRHPAGRRLRDAGDVQLLNTGDGCYTLPLQNGDVPHGG